MNIRTALVAGALSWWAVPAVSHGEEMLRKIYPLFTSTDLPHGEKHLAVMSFPDNPSLLVVFSYDLTEHKPLGDDFKCTGKLSEAYWEVPIPYQAKPLPPLTAPQRRGVTITPKDQSLTAIPLILGCRKPSLVA